MAHIVSGPIWGERSPLGASLSKSRAYIEMNLGLFPRPRVYIGGRRSPEFFSDPGFLAYSGKDRNFFKSWSLYRGKKRNFSNSRGFLMERKLYATTRTSLRSFLSSRTYAEGKAQNFSQAQSLNDGRARNFSKSQGLYTEKKLHTTTRPSCHLSKSQSPYTARVNLEIFLRLKGYI